MTSRHIIHNAFCVTHGFWHRIGGIIDRHTTEQPTCKEGDPPAGVDRTDSEPWLEMVESTNEYQYSISIKVEKPGVLTFESDMGYDGGHERCCHDMAVDVPLAEFLTKLGLHREAAAGELLAVCRRLLDLPSELDGDRIVDLMRMAEAAIAKATGGTNG